MPIEAVTFDAAGTLFTVATPVGETYARVAAEHGAVLDAGLMTTGFKIEFPLMPPLSCVDTSQLPLERQERAWWQRLVTNVTAHAGEVEAFDAYFDQLYRHYADPGAWVVYPEVPEVLTALRGQGIKLAVVSNFDSRLPPLLAGLGLIEYFDTVVYSSSAGAAKPDPHIFLEALQTLGVAAQVALHVGDNPVADREGALAAGMQVRLVQRSLRSPDARDERVHSLEGIMDMFVQDGSVPPVA